MTRLFHALRTLPAGVWALGFVSLLMDVSSELIHSLLPVFLVGSLGASALVLGLIEGAAEATALAVRVFSGVLSDWLGRRKALAVLGYGLGAASKPLFALAAGPGGVLAARLLDRVGKGIRGAPRDALVSEIAPPAARGAAFGLRQSLDTVGAFLGPLLAMGLMLAWANDFRRVFWVALLPGALAVGLLVLGVREPGRADADKGSRVNPLQARHLRRLPPAFWWVVGVGAVFTLARFSEAFLVLRASEAGLPIALTPLVLIGMNLVYSLAAFPFGHLSDRVSRTRVLGWGMAALIAADAALALPGGGWTGCGIALWGLHMGMTQGLLAALVADTSPPDLRGTAFGLFNLVSGGATLLASAAAGLIWDRFGSPAAFAAGGGFAALTLAALALRPSPAAPSP